MVANEVAGGSVGDPVMASVAIPTNLAILREMYEVNFDYDASHNRLFRALLKGKLVADYGCGHGFSTFYLSLREGCTVIGFDIDCRAINYANRLKDKFGTSNVRFVCHKPYDTGYPDEYFDAVVSGDVIEHVHRPMLYLAEANRILKTGGTLYLSTPNGLIARGDFSIIKSHSRFHVYEYSPKELHEMLHATGFILDRVFRQFVPSDWSSSFSRRNHESDSRGRSFCHNLVRRQLELFYGTSKRGHLPYLIQMKSKKLVKKLTPSVNYHVAPIALEQVSRENCDAILITATKFDSSEKASLKEPQGARAIGLDSRPVITFEQWQ